MNTDKSSQGWPGQEPSGRQDTKEQAEEWSGIAEVRTGGVHSESGSGRKQTGCRYRGSWETYTKALTAGLA
ncbi:unnamed protein product, partial [Staurois parvus]